MGLVWDHLKHPSPILRHDIEVEFREFSFIKLKSLFDCVEYESVAFDLVAPEELAAWTWLFLPILILLNQV
jgi:hypothetical protein